MTEPRIIEQELATEPLESVSPHPRNPRHGDVEIIGESIARNGFYGAVIAQRSTGFILAGNHRFLAAREAGLETIPVLWVDVDDDEAMRILLADNRTSDLATYDDSGLLGLLRELQAEEAGLLGTGYGDDDIERLVESTLGESEGAFLDPLAGDRGDEGAGTVVRTDGDTVYFSIAYTVTADERSEIQAAVRRAKDVFKVTTSTQALLAICGRFMESAPVTTPKARAAASGQERGRTARSSGRLRRS